MTFWDVLLDWFRRTQIPQPTPPPTPVPPATFVGAINVFAGGTRAAIDGLVATLMVNGQPPALPVVYTGFRAQFTIPSGALGWGAELTLEAPGFTFVSRHIDHLASDMGEFELRKKIIPPVVVPPIVQPPIVLPPGPGQDSDDMIPIDQITFVGGPNIGAFAKTAKLTRLEIRVTGVYVEFTKQRGPDRWPDQVFGTEGGSLQFSMGLGYKVGGRWYAAAPEERWFGRDEGGPIQEQDVILPDVPRGKSAIELFWYDSSRWSPLHTRHPLPGEEIIMFVCAGDARNNNCPLQERSNIVIATLPAPGMTFTKTWE